MPNFGDSRDQKPFSRRRHADGDPRQFLDERMRELLDQLDRIPYERAASDSAEAV